MKTEIDLLVVSIRINIYVLVEINRSKLSIMFAFIRPALDVFFH